MRDIAPAFPRARPGIIANEQDRCRKAALRRLEPGGQSRFVNSVGPALVINQAAWTKLRDREKACALEIRRLARRIPFCRYECV
jgi:hypothetical protein